MLRQVFCSSVCPWNYSKVSRLVSWCVCCLQTPLSLINSKWNTLKFWPKVTHLLIWASQTFDDKWNSGRMVRDSTMVIMDSLQKTAIALSNGMINDRLRPLLPQNGGPKCTPCDMSKYEWPYLRNGWSHPLYVWWIGLGSADRITLFPFWSNPRWRPWRDMTSKKISTRAERRRLSF